jgi:putative ABC transport system permease protein
MLVSPLDRKLLRDLWQVRSLAAAIALVMGCGIALFLLSRSMIHSLELTQQTYYDRGNFAEVFATVKRAPDSLVERLADVPGVSQVEQRIVVAVRLSLAGFDEPISGRLISFPDHGMPKLNVPYLRQGRWLAPQADDEALASEAFCEAHGLGPGDEISAVINGRLKKLRIVGVVLSPEYIYEIKIGDMVPDNRHYGVFWMNHEALSMAYDLDGAFNDLSFTLLRGAVAADVIQRVDELIERYGGLGAYERKDQLSHQFVNNEIEQNRNMGMFAPSLFLCVAAFLINVVMTRTINSQRDQIAALKAFGYSNVEIGWHYVKFVLLIVAASLAVGVPGGRWFGHTMTGMYARIFHFPEFLYRLRFSLVLGAAGVGVFAGVAGALAGIVRAARLPPAEAMRAEPPAGFGPTILERLGLGKYVPPVLLMIVRQLERRPAKTAFSVVAIALAVSVLVIGNFFQDSIDYMMDSLFFGVQRYDMSVATVEPSTERAMYELADMPGVIACEPTRTVSCRLRAGPRSRRVGITGRRVDGQLFGLMNMDGTTAPLPPRGLLISRKLGEVLGVGPGDSLEVEVLEGRRPRRTIPVSAMVEDFAGLSAYMNLDELRRIMFEGPVLTGVQMLVDPREQDALYRELQETPGVATVLVKRHSIDSFTATISKNLGVMKKINLFFACVIAVGVVYNSARISLAERSRELATLRVIGFSRGEISAILLGELAIVTLLAIPVGLALGNLFAYWMCLSFDEELFRFPMVVTRRTMAWSALVVALASAISGLVVRRGLDRLDLVAVLKARE